MTSLKRKRLNSSFNTSANNTVESLRADGTSRVQVGNSYTEIYNYEGRQADDKCLRDLQTTDPRIDKTRIEKDNGGLLQGSYHWVLAEPNFRQWRHGTSHRLLWVKGDPGKGKTMLLCGLIDELKGYEHTFSYFFCQATDSRINNPTSVLRGLIYLLAVQETSLLRHVRNKWDHGGKSAFDPPNGWHTLCSIFEDILYDHSKPTCLVIDALDECEGRELPVLLGLISSTTSQFDHIKWLVSSRNLPEIDRGLGGANPSERLDLSLEMNAGPVSNAVANYINERVNELRYEASVREEVKETMRNKANGTFLWAALAFKKLQAEEENESAEPLTVLNEVPEGLNSLYNRMWRQINFNSNSNSCKTILATMFLACRPLQLLELPVLTGFKANLARPATLARLVRRCGSFLTIQQDTDTVHFVHQSAKEFLTNNADVVGEMFPSGMGDVHRRVFSCSLESMTAPTGLRRNMYELAYPGVLTSEIKIPAPDPLVSIRYSCLYWFDHFSKWISSKGITEEKDRQAVITFFEDRYLYWLEALVLLGSLTQGIMSIRMLEDLAHRNEWEDLNALVRDARRFVLSNRRGIETAPLQLYFSALIFSPSSSWVRKRFEMLIPEWVMKKPTMQPEWDECLLTLEGHEAPIDKLAFAPDNKIMASIDSHGIIKTWDPYTGACLNTILSDQVQPFTMAFPTADSGASLMSAGIKPDWDNHSVRIWDPLNGTKPREAFLLQPRAWDIVRCLADGRTWVTNNGRGRLLKWNLYTVLPLDTFNLVDEHQKVKVSPDGQTVITYAGRKNGLQVWDWCNPKTCRHTLGSRHQVNPSRVAFSPDSTQLVCEYENRVVKVWDLITGICTRTLVHADNFTSCLALSPGARVAASGNKDGTIGLWNITTDTFQVLSGHGDRINTVAISPDGMLLASGSDDCTIKIWDPTTRPAPQSSRTDPSDIAKELYLSPKGLWIASHMKRGTIKIWSSAKSECVFETPSQVFKLAFSPDDQWLTFSLDDGTINIWNTTTWKLQYRVQGSSGSALLAIVCSTTLGMKLASAVSAPGFIQTIEVWDLDAGRLQSTLLTSFTYPQLISFPPNGQWLALASDKRLEIWDWAAEERVWRLDGNIGDISWHPGHGSLLHTSSGDFHIRGCMGNFSVEKVHRWGLDGRAPVSRHVQITPDSEWITVRGKRVLWLPPQYRPCVLYSGYAGSRLPTGESMMIANSSGIAIAGRCNRIIYFQFDASGVELKLDKDASDSDE